MASGAPVGPSQASVRREEEDLSPPSPRAAVVGLILIVVAVFLCATRITGSLAPVAIDLFKTAEGWQVGPDPALAKVTPARTRPDALDVLYQAPLAQGEDLFMEVTFVGTDGSSLLPGAPIQPGWNQALLEPASRFLSVRLRNSLFRWERPLCVVVRGGPPRAPDPPGEFAVLGAVMAALLLSLGIGTVAGQRALLHLGLVLLLLSSGAVYANQHSPYRIFLSGEAATAVAAAPALLALLTGRISERRRRRLAREAGVLPSMGGAHI